MRDIPAQTVLALKKHEQKAKFLELAITFSDVHESIQEQGNEFITSLWSEYNHDLGCQLLPRPPFSFLRNSLIAMTMFANARGNWLKTELSFLENIYTQTRLKDLLIEDYAGKPRLANLKYLTSHNTIHHLYHYTRFIDFSTPRAESIRTVVEWGGGYGNLAKLILRVIHRPVTYIIIDTSLFCCLQWIYLTTILGAELVNIITNPDDCAIEKHKINLLPLGLMDCYDFSADLFVSTWALSESSRHAQDYVRGKKWFEAKHLLLAYQDPEFCQRLPDTGRIGQLAFYDGATVFPIDFVPGNYYAFK